MNGERLAWIVNDRSEWWIVGENDEWLGWMMNCWSEWWMRLRQLLIQPLHNPPVWRRLQSGRYAPRVLWRRAAPTNAAPPAPPAPLAAISPPVSSEAWVRIPPLPPCGAILSLISERYLNVISTKYNWIKVSHFLLFIRNLHDGKWRGQRQGEWRCDKRQ